MKPETNTLKRCAFCRISKSLDSFFNRQNRPSGKMSRCKKCCMASRFKWGKQNAEKVNAYGREYKRKWYKSHRKSEIKRCALWNRKNPERVAYNMQACRKRQPAHFKEYYKTYRKNNPERVRIWGIQNRAKRRNAIAGDRITLTDWQQLLSVSKNSCFYCHRSDQKMTMDHVTPLSKGGKHRIDNIVAACRSCNSRKQDMDFFDFIWENGVAYAGV
jgi:5-methylcytosine-specific restriction endonuclease McrA